MKCLNCGFSNDNEAKFCEKCGDDLTKQNEKRNKNRLKSTKEFVIILFFIYLIIFIGNHFYVTHNMKEYVREGSGYGVNYRDVVSYNQKERTIYIKVYTTLKIKQWQIDAIGRNRVKCIYYVGQRALDYDSIHLVAGENMYITYKIKNSSLRDFIDFKKTFENSETGLDEADIINPDVEIRQQVKNQYYAELQRQKLRQQYIRSLMYYPYY